METKKNVNILIFVTDGFEIPNFKTPLTCISDYSYS